jgi:putative glycosyltransferase
LAHKSHHETILSLFNLEKLGLIWLRLRIISTTFNSQETITPFLNSLNTAVNIPGVELPVPVIIVNDGSRDSTLKLLLNSNQPNLKLRVLDLARNYGHHQAIFAGIRELDDDFDFLVIIDSDLEEDPNDIPRLIGVIQSTDSDVVVGHLSKRANHFSYRLIADLADLFLRFAIGPKFIPRVCTLRIMRGHVALQLRRNKEEYPVLGLAQQRLGLVTTRFAIKKTFKGKTEYTFRKKIKLFVQILASASDLHTRLALFLGILGISFSLICGIWLLYYRINNPNALAGYTSIALLISFYSGILIFLTSLISRLLMKLIKSNSGETGVVIRSRNER